MLPTAKDVRISCQLPLPLYSGWVSFLNAVVGKKKKCGSGLEREGGNKNNFFFFFFFQLQLAAEVLEG